MKNLDNIKIMSKGEMGFLKIFLVPLFKEVNNFMENSLK